VSFIDAHRARFGVEPICRVLEIAPSTYYARRSRLPSRRAVEDARLLGRIRDVHAMNYHAYGSRRTWKTLRRQGVEVGRGRVERLMRRHGLQGAQRQAKRRWLTQADEAAPRPADLVERRFVAQAPNQFWVCDLTYLKTREGFVFLAFVKDVFSRMIVGWQTAEHLRTDLVLEALEMAVHLRRPPHGELVAHTDRGSQGGFQWSSQRPIRRGCDGQAEASVGSSRAAGNAITGSATGRSSRTPAALLGGDCARRAQRRGRCRGGRVAGGGRPVVSGGWRDAADRSGSAVRAVPDVRRARGDRGAAGRWLWGARGCAPAGSLTVDDLAGVAAQRRDAQRPLGLPGDDGAVACRSAR
jgi:putative transposase